MKKLIILVTILLAAACSRNPAGYHDTYIIKADDSCLTDSLKSVYMEDSYRLALRYFMENESNWINIIEIPENLTAQFYYGLVHIFNAKQIAARNSVVDIFPIHTFPNPTLHRIIIAVDTNSTWIQNWKTGNIYTGIGQIDSLIAKYDFNIKRCRIMFNTYYSTVLETPNSINILSVAKKMARIEDVIYAEPDGAEGDGNDIIADIKDNTITYKFCLRWGDCPCGCIYEHEWFFKVFFNGNVEFLLSTGEPVSKYRRW